MNGLIRYEVSFAGPDEDPRFAKIKSIILSKRIQDGVIAIWPKGGLLYENQIVMTSPDGRHTTVLRGNCYSELQTLLSRGYHVINGKYHEKNE